MLIEDLDYLLKHIHLGVRDIKDTFQMTAYDYANKAGLKAFKEVLELK